jgi:outer membrane receptor for ferrienterochelin and colicins
LPSILTAGSEYSNNRLEDEMLGYHRTITQTVKMKSLYLQNEWKNEKLSILLGSRFDKHNLIKDPIVSPRFNIRYNLSDFINFRASFSNGFRAPQTFDEDLHVSAVGGKAVLVQIAPGLKAERSKSSSVSADIYKTFGEIQTNLLIEGFYTDLNNVFFLEETGIDTDGNLILERKNGSGAIVNGINIEGKIATARNIQFQFGATFQKSEFKKNQKWSNNENLAPHRKMFRSPGQYGYLTATWSPSGKLNISFSGIYTGSMLVQHFAGYVSEDSEKKTPSFYDANLKVSHDISFKEQVKLQLSAGLQNIFNSYQSDFDKGEFRDAGFIYGPALPRTIFIGAKVVL